MICGFVVLRGPLKEHVVFPDPNKGPNGTEPRRRTLTWAYPHGIHDQQEFQFWALWWTSFKQVGFNSHPVFRDQHLCWHFGP